MIDQLSYKLTAETKDNICKLFANSQDAQTQRDYLYLKQQADKNNLLRQRKVYMTPTLLKVSEAHEEESCRIIRSYKQHIQHFVRLSFVNEHLERGFYLNTDAEQCNYLLGYIHSVVSKGFSVGNLRFDFLAYSNSQLKQHSAWFLCKQAFGRELREEEIIGRMGNFDAEQNVLKKQARKGQCFSTSTFVCELQPHQVQMGVEDVKRNGFCFTDGVGFISTKLALEVAKKLKMT